MERKRYIVLTGIEEKAMIPIVVPIDSFWISIAEGGGTLLHFFHREETIFVNEPFNYIIGVLEKDGSEVYRLPDEEEEEESLTTKTNGCDDYENQYR